MNKIEEGDLVLSVRKDAFWMLWGVLRISTMTG
jgi:hypothetical protein